jgi:hypothetical protein
MKATQEMMVSALAETVDPSVWDIVEPERF